MEDNRVLSKTFLWMFLGLLVTGVVSWYTYSSGLFISIFYEGFFNILLIAEIVVVLLFSFLFRKLPAVIVAVLYFIYAIINGVTMSVIFVLFEMTSIYVCFFASAIAFAAMAVVGYKTDMDLGRFRPMLYGILIAGIIMSIVNIFLARPMLDIVISWVILAVFFGITAYDIQKIKNLVYYDNIDTNKIHIYGAMEIYLDFVNIFIRILSIFGKRK
jgi:FtsH-binding integral membrane protein